MLANKNICKSACWPRQSGRSPPDIKNDSPEGSWHLASSHQKGSKWASGASFEAFGHQTPAIFKVNLQRGPDSHLASRLQTCSERNSKGLLRPISPACPRNLSNEFPEACCKPLARRPRKTWDLQILRLWTRSLAGRTQTLWSQFISDSGKIFYWAPGTHN